MKILSWDVGIKNLAYAIIEFTDKTNNFKIIKWDIINLLDDTIKCCHILQGKKKNCSSTAKYIFNIKENNEEPQYYCKKHCEKIDYQLVIPISEIKCQKCKQNSIKIIKNTSIGWCEKHFEKESGIYKRRCIKKIDQSCTKQSLVKLGKSMFEKLDCIPELLQCDEIIIENQPVLKNPTMKTIASMLFSYFIIRGINENKGLYSENKLNFVSASGKLKVNKKKTNNELKKGKNEKDVYNITKGLSIKYCKAIITDIDLQFLDKFKKKDDLCDAVLQAIRVYYNDDIPDIISNKFKNII